MASKSITKNVRFDFYETYLIYDLDHLNEARSFLQKKAGSEQTIRSIDAILKNPDAYSERCTLESILNAIKSNILASTTRVGDKIVEIDTKSFMPKDEKDSDIIYFQMVNNRDVDIPDKRKIGHERIAIELEDDEYIGEFMGILYDLQTKTVMMQVNKHSLVKSQVESYFTQKRNEYLKSTENANDTLDFCKSIIFAPITDPEEIERMKASKDKVSFSLKGSDISLSAFSQKAHMLSDLSSYFSDTMGVTYTVTVSVDARKKKCQPLNDDVIDQALCGFNALEDHLKPIVEVGFRETPDAPVEVINWLVPKMCSKIKFEYTPRKSLGYEVVYHRMLEAFRTKQPRLARIVFNKNIAKN